MPAPEVPASGYTRILVVADLHDLGMMQHAENAFAARAVKDSSLVFNGMICDPICRTVEPTDSTVMRGTSFIPAHTVLFPGRSYTDAELRQALAAQGIDATLVLSPTSAGVSETYVPPTYLSQCSAGGARSSCYTSALAGGTLRRPWVSFAARLYDARTGETAWIATSTSNGSALSSNSELISSMATSVLQRLEADRIIR